MCNSLICERNICTTEYGIDQKLVRSCNQRVQGRAQCLSFAGEGKVQIVAMYVTMESGK